MTTETKVSSADLKKQIEEATKQSKVETQKDSLVNSGLPLTGGVANQINASASTPEAPKQAESKPQEPQAPAEKVTASSVDYKDWAKKKGIDWTTDDSILSALHKSDQAFHNKRKEERVREEAERPRWQAQGTPPPAPNYYLPYQAPPTYAQPPQRQVIESIARNYNMVPEDAEKLAAFNRDFFEAAMRGEREKSAKEMEAFKVENQKNSVFRELSMDPSFKRPEVGVEFYNVLEQMQESDPQSFEKDPNQYRRAYDKALQNIGRRYLEGRPLVEGVSPSPFTVPTTPPRPLGQGSAGGAYESESAIDPQVFAKLSLDEKRKVIEKMGLRAAE